MKESNVPGLIDLRAVNRMLRRYNAGLLKRYLGRTVCDSVRIDADVLNKGIFTPLSDFLGRGGKRWRVSLFDTVLKITGGSKERYRKYSVITELIHNGTLMADDIEDNSPMRRGLPALHLIYGTDIVLNLSQFLYFFPLIELPELKDKDLRSKLMNIYIEEMIKLASGQAVDIVWHKGLYDIGKITVRDYLTMCSMKTGSLARMSVRMACAFAGTDRSKERSLAGFATALGIAFQIRDDILDITESGLSAKKGGTGNDITEGKITLVVLRTLKVADRSDRKRLLGILMAHTRDRRKIIKALDIIQRYDGISFSLETARSVLKRSFCGLKREFSENKVKKLREFADFCLNRDV